MAFTAGRFSLTLDEPQVMGILNLTPDSFSDGGQFHDGHRLRSDQLLVRARRMVDAGVAVLDMGGESTRPGAHPVSEDEELERVIPALELLRREFEIPLSVDTSSPGVMREAAAKGADLINDVRALCRPGALEAVADTGLSVCLMHMQGRPRSMQDAPGYQDVVAEVAAFLRERLEACEGIGIARERVILDPGFGFGKTLEHNLALLAGLPRLRALGRPLLVGVSRKSMIGALTGGRSAGDRLAGSLAAALGALERGAWILRVHDVEETLDAVRVWCALREAWQEGN